MAQVFLSYAREDREFAARIARVLEQSGHGVWWDRRLDGGEEFSAEIEAALDAAEVVLVAWSKDSVKSRWVRDEAAVGGDSGTLVPVSIDGSMPPMGFRQFHTLDLVGWKGAKRDERTAELLHSVERRLKARTEGSFAVAAAKPPRGAPFHVNWRRAAGAGVVLIALIAAGLWFWSSRISQSGEPVRPTLALLPLTTASSDPQLRELASETRDSLSNRLSQSGIPVKLLASPPQDPASAGDYLVSGDFSRDGEKVMVTLHLDEAAHGVTTASYQFEAAGDDIRNLPERIGVQMAGNLTWSAPLMILDRRHPADPALVAQLMQGNNYLSDFVERYQNAKRVAAKGPDVREAQVSVAYYTSFVLDAFPIDQRLAAIADARQAFDKARELDPSQGDVEGAWCSLHSEALFLECENHLRAGMARSPDDNWLTEFLAEHLEQVGRLDEAAQLLQLSYTHDPYAPIKIGHMLQMLEFTGATAEANELSQNGERWWPEFKGTFWRNRLLGLLVRGDFQAIGGLEKQKPRPQYRSSADIIAALDSKSAPALRAACADALGDNVDPYFPLRCLVAFNKLGDKDSAYALADKLYPRRVGATPAQTERFWIDNPDAGAPLQLLSSPSTAAMRQDPRFPPLAQRTGLLAYWRSGRAPDFCTKQHEPVCVQLLKRS
jgi:TolB-like protein